MNRWFKTALVAATLAAASAGAQTFVREAPRDVKPATIIVSATPPIITLDGKEDRLSPGARIRDLNNMLVLSGSLAGQTVQTVYRRDGAGLVHEVWLLTADEYRRLGGVDAASADGYKRFAELLNLIFGARAARAAK